MILKDVFLAITNAKASSPPDEHPVLTIIPHPTPTNNPPNMAFIKLLFELDNKFYEEKFGAWMMKDTTLSGLFAAIGTFYIQKYTYNVSLMLDFIHNIIAILNNESIKYEEFQDAYHNLSSVTVNIGNVVRKAVYHYFMNLFLDKPISWQEAFIINWNEEE